MGSRGALWVPRGWGRSLQRTWRSLKGAQGVSGGILRILASLAEVGLMFSGVPEGSMWSLGLRGVLVAFLGSSGAPVRVLTASQVGPSACRGKAQGILGGPVSPQGPGEGFRRVLREGPWGIPGVQQGC